MTNNSEERIHLYMQKLGINREEALELLSYDKEVDHMKKRSEIDADLTPEQKAVIKKMKNFDSKTKKATTPTVYKFDTKTARKDETKESLVAALAEFVGERVGNIEVINASRLLGFTMNGEHFTLTLTRNTKKK